MLEKLTILLLNYVRRGIFKNEKILSECKRFRIQLHGVSFQYTTAAYGDGLCFGPTSLPRSKLGIQKDSASQPLFPQTHVCDVQELALCKAIKALSWGCKLGDL